MRRPMPVFPSQVKEPGSRQVAIGAAPALGSLERLAGRQRSPHNEPMRGFWLTRVSKVTVLLAFLASIQFLAAPTPAMAMDMAQAASKTSATDCLHCDMSGASAAPCHMSCTPISTVTLGGTTDVVSPTSSWPVHDIAVSGRVVPPTLAPPRFS